ncbi:MFS transporter [uncultured Caballeronia sp.]|uniref:MFS transporter n=1 Tax=uncultured Caballeronia sp. TaxID=1827198 RepID=UPI0015762528
MIKPSSALSARRSAPAVQWAQTGPTLALLVFAAFLVVGQMYAVLPLYGAMGATFGVAPRAVAWTSTAFGFAYAVGFLVAGPLTDRYGARTMISFGLVLAAAATALVATAVDIKVAIEMRVLQGFLSAMFTPAAYSYVANHVRPERRSLALSFLASSLLAAAVVMQVCSQLIVSRLNWQALFLICAALMLVTGSVAWFTLQGSRAEYKTSIVAAFQAMPRLLSQPRLVAIYLATMTLLGGFVGIYSAIALAGLARGVADAHALLALRLSGLPAMIAVPLLAPYIAFLTPRVRVVTGMALAAGTALASSFADGNIVLLGAVMLLFLGGIVMAAPALVELISESVTENRGVATSLYAFSMFAGGSICGQLVSQMTGLDFGFGVIVKFVCAILGAGALLITMSKFLASPAQAFAAQHFESER